jgi:malate dehydrogenase
LSNPPEKIKMAEPVRVVITGAAGQIGYSLVYMVASGSVFGPNQPMILQLLDIPPAMGILGGLLMELDDCAFPLVKKVVATADPMEAFKDADAAFMVGAFPRKEGMERKDLLTRNIEIFKVQGTAIDQVAKKSIKVLVVGNPANTNAAICAHYAPSIPKENFSAMTRLDHNRALSQLAVKSGNEVCNVKNVIIWGNHSSTQFPDASHATINGKPAPAVINDDEWLKSTFIPTVQKRGAAVLNARKASSAMSAAKAACDHIKSLWHGTPEGEWVSMGVFSDGKHYNAPEGVMFSFPVTVNKNKEWKIVEGLELSDFAKSMLKITGDELVSEKAEAMEILA